MLFQISGGIVLFVFYCIYIGKIIVQKKKGIQTNQIAKSKSDTKVHMIEWVMKITTYSIVVIEAISIMYNATLLSSYFRGLGLVISVFGVSVFALSVWTMKDNWRAGIAENDKTEIVITGIYRFSRNPAFLGFDLVYIGIV